MFDYRFQFIFPAGVLVFMQNVLESKVIGAVFSPPNTISCALEELTAPREADFFLGNP